MATAANPARARLAAGHRLDAVIAEGRRTSPRPHASSLGIALLVLEGQRVRSPRVTGASPGLDRARQRILRQRATGSTGSLECLGRLGGPGELFEQHAAKGKRSQVGAGIVFMLGQDATEIGHGFARVPAQTGSIGREEQLMGLIAYRWFILAAKSVVGLLILAVFFVQNRGAGFRALRGMVVGA